MFNFLILSLKLMYQLNDHFNFLINTNYVRIDQIEIYINWMFINDPIININFIGIFLKIISLKHYLN